MKIAEFNEFYYERADGSGIPLPEHLGQIAEEIPLLFAGYKMPFDKRIDPQDITQAVITKFLKAVKDRSLGIGSNPGSYFYRSYCNELFDIKKNAFHNLEFHDDHHGGRPTRDLTAPYYRQKRGVNKHKGKLKFDDGKELFADEELEFFEKLIEEFVTAGQADKKTILQAYYYDDIEKSTSDMKRFISSTLKKESNSADMYLKRAISSLKEKLEKHEDGSLAEKLRSTLHLIEALRHKEPQNHSKHSIPAETRIRRELSRAFENYLEMHPEKSQEMFGLVMLEELLAK